MGDIVVGSGIACTACAAAADSSEGRGWCAGGVGDYQIAPIAARSTAMGRWRLTPPWYWGDTACGRDGGRGTPHPPPSGAPVSLRVGRFAGLTRHRRVIQHRGPLRGKALGGCAARGEGLGDKKKRPGALLLALFIAFWRCRSARSETGSTGRRRGLRRGRRSWENPWHRRP